MCCGERAGRLSPQVRAVGRLTTIGVIVTSVVMAGSSACFRARDEWPYA
jgi:hypothetical protein